MIVFCEECGERYVMDLDDASEEADRFRCRVCDDMITVSNPKLVARQQAKDMNKSGKTIEDP